MSDVIPAGFVPLFRTSPFIDAVGPLFQRGMGEDMSVGFHVATKHTNTRGHLHGGVVATVGDIALGYALATSKEPPTSAVTTSLSVDFIGSGSVGDWVETRVDFLKVGGRLAFANAYFSVGGQRIARASGVFLVVDAGRK
jgi:uncharacterized protein (TIGR00369 family)